MIRGYFSSDRAIRRPFVRCELEFPDYSDVRPARVEPLIEELYPILLTVNLD